jgi:hypothetical protein
LVCISGLIRQNYLSNIYLTELQPFVLIEVGSIQAIFRIAVAALAKQMLLREMGTCWLFSSGVKL